MEPTQNIAEIDAFWIHDNMKNDEFTVWWGHYKESSSVKIIDMLIKQKDRSSYILPMAKDFLFSCLCEQDAIKAAIFILKIACSVYKKDFPEEVRMVLKVAKYVEKTFPESTKTWPRCKEERKKALKYKGILETLAAELRSRDIVAGINHLLEAAECLCNIINEDEAKVYSRHSYRNSALAIELRTGSNTRELVDMLRYGAELIEKNPLYIKH